MSPEEPSSITPFNPLDKTNLGESVADALLLQPVGPLPPSLPFTGAGVYVIYYEGNFPLYKDISRQNQNALYSWPIYIGKAVPAGARKGGYGLGANPGLVLFKRLAEHATSIKQTQNLRIEDFCCRYLVVDDIWIPLAESLLIEMFAPLWNLKIDGFGNHDPGKGRHKQQMSPWDTLHPGRSWAARLQPYSAKTGTIEKQVKDYLAHNKERVLRQQHPVIRPQNGTSSK